MPNIGPTELLVILLLALIIFGPGKLPQLGKAVGQSFREFKDSMNAVRKEDPGAAGQAQEERPKDRQV